MSATTEMLARKAPRPPYSALGTERPDAIDASSLEEGPDRLPRGASARGRRMRILVAGGAGFIGSAYVRQRLAAHPGDSVRVLDKLTYAGRRENLDGLDPDRVELVEGDIADPRSGRNAAIEGCDATVNFAAESHVDRSIHSPGEFIQTDVFGAFVMLEAARQRRHPPPPGVDRRGLRLDRVRLLHARTRRFEPSSPYSASKAGGDLIVGAYRHTYGTDALIVRGSNNYGPRQHPGEADPALHPQRARR